MPQVDISQGSTYRLTFKAYLSSDHVTPATGKTLAVTVNKNHTGFANPSVGAASATETPGSSYGWYYFDLTAIDTGTAGPLIARATAIGVDDSEVVLQVVPGVQGVRSVNVAYVAGVPAAIAEGSAQAVSSTSITLDLPTNDKRTANNLTNWEVEVVSATTGSGQRAYISAYNAATQLATVTWPTATPSLPVTYNLRAPVTVNRNLDKTGTILGTAAITAGSFAVGAVTPGAFAAGAMDSNAFAQSAADKVWGTVTRALTDKTGYSLAAGAISNGTFTAGAISNTTLANGTLSTATFAPGAITNGLFATGAVDGNALAQSAADKVWNSASRSVTDKAGFGLATGAISSGTFTAGAINNTSLASGALSAATFAPGSITTGVFAPGAIDSTILAQSAADKVWGSASRSLTATDKTGYSLAATGLDAIPLTPPTGSPVLFREALVMLYRRFFKKVVTTRAAITTYADDGTTIITTQALDETQTNGQA